MRTEPEKTDIKCEKCGHFMVIREGRYGKFLGCSNFPACKNIQALEQTVYKGTCPKCGKRMTERKSKAGKVYYSCEDYTNCKFMSWDEPTGKKCPKCDEHIVVKTFRGKTQTKCSNKDCDYIEE